MLACGLTNTDCIVLLWVPRRQRHRFADAITDYILRNGDAIPQRLVIRISVQDGLSMLKQIM